jgi:hypothetical protein
MSDLEGKLWEKGYRYVTRDASVANGYAASIDHTYEGRIEERSAHDSKYGPQVFFKIRLGPPAES